MSSNKVVVGDNKKESKTNLAGSSNSLANKHMGKLALTVSLLIIILLFIAAFLSYLHDKNSKPKAPTVYSVCNAPQNAHLLTEANTDLTSNPINMSDLRNVVLKIQKLPNFDKDPNCNYVLVSFYSQYDVTNAKLYLNKLKQTYNPKVGYSSQINVNAQGIPLIERQITGLEANLVVQQERLNAKPKPKS